MHRLASLIFVSLLSVIVAAPVPAQTTTKSATKSAASKSAPRPDFPPHTAILKGFEKVVSSNDASRTLFTIYRRNKDQQVYGELPAGVGPSQKFYIALTVSSGERFAGLQAGEMYVYFRRFNKSLALIEPNIGVRSTGDRHSKASVPRLFTDRVVMEIPIVTMGPSGGPVIDMDALLVGGASRFFGSSARSSSPRLFSIKKCKAFRDNVELAFELPTSGGRLKTLHYSISKMGSSPGYVPRKADERIGFFTTTYRDLGKYRDEEVQVRFINRWHLEKDDPSLKISPPKNPITFYIEHTTPVRYRRWVEKGVLYWNKAFENIGISNAIQVEFQNARTGRHVEKDPEDVRWNFIRWLNNDVGTAIGPSRVNPLTGEILDADIILTDGWIRHYWMQYNELLPQAAMQGMSPETLAWLAKHPSWDPRIRLAAPSERVEVRRRVARQALSPYAGHPMAQVDNRFIGDDLYDGLIGRTSQVNGLCLAAQGKAFDLSLMKMHLDILAALDDDDDKKKDDKKKDDKKKDDKKVAAKPKRPAATLIDGIPEWFVGPLLSELVAHEVGHTLGLRHNFKSSSIYSLAEINNGTLKGKKPFAGSVMDYIPVNMSARLGKNPAKGDHTMIDIGPYDLWAIEYGYTFSKDLKKILARVAEPELAYATDEDTGGPDPLARRYDFSKNPLDYAKAQLDLVQYHRGRLLEKFVKSGDSWSKARRGYELTLSLQMRSVSMMANWIGGAHVNRDRKGDKNGRAPISVVPTSSQKDALKFVIESTFRDKAYGLSTELLRHMTVDKWLDGGGGFAHAMSSQPAWPVHDRIIGLQASTLTMLMNPTTLRRTYDNEFRIPADQPALTLPDLLKALSTEIWSELGQKPKEGATARKPLVSSLRRNLQQEHIDRLITLSLPGNGSGAAYKAIALLARQELVEIRARVAKSTKDWGGKVDPYTRAHLGRLQDQITKVLDAQMIYNAKDIGGRPALPSFFLQPRDAKLAPPERP
ncbi:MAG: hypothetical protein CMJ69_18350 [Planctomycetaceae bacterium]|nr:hypothetical protein [Planctomycetaceae bacterium]